MIAALRRARVRSAAVSAKWDNRSHSRSARGIAGVVLAAAVAVPVLAACSSSSSPATKAAASASARASALASKYGITPIPDLAPGAHGPNGDITAPASNAPSQTSPGGSEVFPNVSAAQDKQLSKHLSKMHGVQNATYYPQFKQLQVYYTKTATSADRTRVYRYVVGHDPAAAGSPSASPTATATPTSSAS